MTTRNPLNNFPEIFERWAEKAPVRHASSQAIAHRLYRDHVRGWLLTEERFAVAIAIDHARIGEGRAELDAVVAKIRVRLKGEGLL